MQDNWKKRDINYVVRHYRYGGKPTSDIARKLGRSESAVRSIAHRLGLHRG